MTSMPTTPCASPRRPPHDNREQVYRLHAGLIPRKHQVPGSGAVGDAWEKWKAAQVRPEQIELEAI